MFFRVVPDSPRDVHLRIAALDMLNDMSVVHTVVWDPTEPAATRPLLLRNQAGWFTFGFDQAKNVTELFGPSGSIDGSVDYSPFGEAVTASGAAETVTRVMAWEEYVPPPPPVVVTNIIPVMWMDEDGTIHETFETNIYWRTYGGIYIPRQAEFVAPLNPFRFSSEVWDATLSLVCYHARPYNPLDARFITRDPIEERGGLNLYGFVSNDPVNRVDWRGYLTIKGNKQNGRCCGSQKVEDLMNYFKEGANRNPIIGRIEEPFRSAVSNHFMKVTFTCCSNGENPLCREKRAFGLTPMKGVLRDVEYTYFHKYEHPVSAEGITVLLIKKKNWNTEAVLCVDQLEKKTMLQWLKTAIHETAHNAGWGNHYRDDSDPKRNNFLPNLDGEQIGWGIPSANF